MNGFNRMRGFGRPSMFPPVLKSLLIINIGVYLLQYLFFGFYSIGEGTLNEYFMKYFALQPIFGVEDARVTALGSFYPWQLITYQFMHGGFWHLAFNMFVLWMFGTELENLWGSKRFLIYYLLAGVGAGIFQLFITPTINLLRFDQFITAGFTVGASGSIYGLLLAFGLTFPDRPIFMFPFFIPIPAKFFVMIFAGIELFLGFTGGDGVAHFAHLGGAATGFILLKFGDQMGIYSFFERLFSSGQKTSDYTTYQSYVEEEKPKKRANVFKADWAKKEAEEEPEEKNKINIDGEEITQKRIDEILDKISESGYANLSEKEKRILFELSQKLK